MVKHYCDFCGTEVHDLREENMPSEILTEINEYDKGRVCMCKENYYGKN